MVYAGFWRRLYARIVDFLVLIPPGLLFGWLASHSRALAMVLILPSTALFSAYTIVLHAKGGRTIGKMASGIRVVDVQGERIGWYRALLRSSVDMIAALISAVMNIVALSRISDAVYDKGHSNGILSDEFQEYALELNNAGFVDWLNTFLMLWFVAQMVTLLLNKKKRAVHDFIAGTVVKIDKPSDKSEFNRIVDNLSD